MLDGKVKGGWGEVVVFEGAREGCVYNTYSQYFLCSSLSNWMRSICLYPIISSILLSLSPPSLFPQSFLL